MWISAGSKKKPKYRDYDKKKKTNKSTATKITILHNINKHIYVKVIFRHICVSPSICLPKRLLLVTCLWLPSYILLLQWTWIIYIIRKKQGNFFYLKKEKGSHVSYVHLWLRISESFNAPPLWFVTLQHRRTLCIGNSLQPSSHLFSRTSPYHSSSHWQMLEPLPTWLAGTVPLVINDAARWGFCFCICRTPLTAGALPRGIRSCPLFHESHALSSFVQYNATRVWKCSLCPGNKVATSHMYVLSAWNVVSARNLLLKYYLILIYLYWNIHRQPVVTILDNVGL